MNNLFSIENFQNISLFGISTYTLFAFLIHINGYEMGIVLMDKLYPFVGLHAIVDFFLTKSCDLQLHHLCILGILFYNYVYQVSLEHRLIFMYPLLKSEISSIFYVLQI